MHEKTRKWLDAEIVVLSADLAHLDSGVMAAAAALKTATDRRDKAKAEFDGLKADLATLQQFYGFRPVHHGIGEKIPGVRVSVEDAVAGRSELDLKERIALDMLNAGIPGAVMVDTGAKMRREPDSREYEWNAGSGED